MADPVVAALVLGVPEVGGHVYYDYTVAIDEEPPFLVVQQGVYTLDGTWQGVAKVLDVWVYLEQDSSIDMDVVVDEVKAALNNKRFVGDDLRPFFVVWSGSPAPDQVEPNRQAVTRPVRFYVYTLNWLSSRTFGPDPVQALQDWVLGTFPGVGADPATWNPADPSPAVYWRVARVTEVEPTNWGSWYTAEIRGHVLVPAVAPRHTWIRLLYERLGVERNRVVMSNGSRMTIGSVAADLEADPFRDGQLTLVVRYGLTCEEVLAIDQVANTVPAPWPEPVPALAGPPIHHVHVKLDGQTTEVIIP